jgi:HEPN domain-containing protein
MRDERAEAERWLRQAEHDLEFAQFAVREGYFSQACSIATRHPNGLAGGVPFEAFGERQAREAVEAAGRFVAVARGRFGAR